MFGKRKKMLREIKDGKGNFAVTCWTLESYLCFREAFHFCFFSDEKENILKRKGACGWRTYENVEICGDNVNAWWNKKELKPKKKKKSVIKSNYIINFRKNIRTVSIFVTITIETLGLVTILYSCDIAPTLAP